MASPYLQLLVLHIYQRRKKSGCITHDAFPQRDQLCDNKGKKLKALSCCWRSCCPLGRKAGVQGVRITPKEWGRDVQCLLQDELPPAGGSWGAQKHMVYCREDPTYSEGVIPRWVKTNLHVFQEILFCTNTSGYFPLKKKKRAKHHINPCPELFLYIFCMCAKESVKCTSISCSVLLRPKYIHFYLQKVTKPASPAYLTIVALFSSQERTYRLLGVSHVHIFIWDMWACFQLRLCWKTCCCLKMRQH